ncbi:hypothetical protein RFI_18009 [Reticulomyxa filosa]|uniref:ABC-2 type transporter transmembrane domain-containing protein n=1 Tax=Reticulomyxa filosa TaxID=46433 RepID=X6N0F5_RETFI|nr:hypothetical protein RFI_18009 [Reticulomyxa filosa]|eukprot:ETO19224.1 hypothetical protein RFI_18009 [Reticulomyxa filosa]
MVIFIALCQSIMFSGIDNACENIQNRRGLDFLTISFNCAMASILSLLTVPSMSNVIEKERKSNRMYSSILWVSTRALVVIPTTWLQLIIFVGIVKFFIPFNAGFGSILLILGCTMMAVDSIASIIGNSTGSTKIAFQVLFFFVINPLIIMPFLVFANYLITKTEIPSALRWLVNLSPWYWALNALAIKDFSGVDFECTQVVDGVTMTTHLRGNYVLRNMFDIDPDGFGLAVGMLLVLFIGFRLISFIPLCIQFCSKNFTLPNSLDPNKLFYFSICINIKMNLSDEQTNSINEIIKKRTFKISTNEKTINFQKDCWSIIKIKQTTKKPNQPTKKTIQKILFPFFIL